ncbi:phosphopantetheine-binding protein [Streptomyces sp. NPDC101219]|uniref:phosphopantetheine-binding protein n=1 Tax=Streptomyces sp. NPDC101219 TaxID=3366131 RepID=UPI00380FFBC8
MVAYETLEQILRAQLPALEHEPEVPKDLPLAAVGLDSVATVVLMDTLEDILGVTFPDHTIAPATFRTPGSLWAVLDELANG